MFDEFLLFILAVQSLKEKTEEAPNAFPMHPVWTTEQIIESLPYDLTKAQLNVWHEIERDLSGQDLERFNIFRIEMLIRHAADGNLYLYDMVNIKKETSTPLEQ